MKEKILKVVGSEKFSVVVVTICSAMFGQAIYTLGHCDGAIEIMDEAGSYLNSVTEKIEETLKDNEEYKKTSCE